mgnify:CR=1 FL=1
MTTLRLTMAQALVRYLINQFTMVDGKKVPLFPGVFAIFGHGNVTCLSEALEAVQDKLPTWRGQNEQSMALAAIGFALMVSMFSRTVQSSLRRKLRYCRGALHGRPRLVALAAGLHVSRLDGSPMVYNEPDPWLPDFVVCRPELAAPSSTESARADEKPATPRRQIAASAPPATITSASPR